MKDLGYAMRLSRVTCVQAGMVGEREWQAKRYCFFLRGESVFQPVIAALNAALLVNFFFLKILTAVSLQWNQNN